MAFGLAGLAAAGLFGWLWSRADREAAILRTENETLKVHAAETAEKLKASEFLQAEVVSLRKENEGLKTEAATLRAQHKAAQDMIAWVGDAEKVLKEAFKGAATDVVVGTSGQVARQAGEVVSPLKESLDRLDGYVRNLEAKRAETYGELQTQLGNIQSANVELTRTTIKLSQALRSSGVRGKWGELQLERVAELAGMVKGVHYIVQEQRGEGRPDMIVKLPGGGELPVDAKAPMEAYLDSLDAADDSSRSAKLDAHAEALKRRITDLGRKEYWKQFANAPEFVVMFIPIESSLAPAFDRAPDLLELAVDRRVLIATPVTLLALLKTVVWGWQQQNVAANIRQIEELCRDFYSRLQPFLAKFEDTGKKLGQAVDSYNATVGSYTDRVLPAVRRLKELGAGTEDPPDAKAVERRPRQADGGGNEPT
jgi:DNA recombination protein RmuC